MKKPPTTLTELDQYFKEKGVNIVVNRFQYHSDVRVASERVEVEISASGFVLNEDYQEDFDNILREAMKNG